MKAVLYSDAHCEMVLAGFGISSPDDALIWRDRQVGGALILKKAKSPEIGISGLIIENEEENQALVSYLLACGTSQIADIPYVGDAIARPA
ncbi:hypothetical protein [Brevundimonas sp.]|uniref:hypothetical protein n=1 Tax=Brevundimonas sp. TaxID=1871086 RepID=UPI002D340E29|nr:hypothetical protein [Brevundimonas sp.]HYC98276.1 hypothetical protein [Brevundimonas sp.]